MAHRAICPLVSFIDLMVHRLPSYPYDDTTLLGWLHDLYKPGQLIDTLDLLSNLNTHIRRTFKYDSREAHGVQLLSLIHI